MLKILRQKNEKLILKYKDNELELKKQKLIKNILSDYSCFFKMNIETAYSILRDLQIDESQLQKVYKKLIEKKDL